jgi:hypothetical protein
MNLDHSVEFPTKVEAPSVEEGASLLAADHLTEIDNEELSELSK